MALAQTYQRYVDEWRFWVPRALTEVNSEETKDNLLCLTLILGREI